MSQNNRLPQAQFTCVRNQYYRSEEVDRYLDALMSEFSGMRVERMRLETELERAKKQLSEAMERETYMLQAVESAQQESAAAVSSMAAVENELNNLRQVNEQLEQSLRMLQFERSSRTVMQEPIYASPASSYHQPNYPNYAQETELQRLRADLNEMRASFTKLAYELKKSR